MQQIIARIDIQSTLTTKEQNYQPITNAATTTNGVNSSNKENVASS
jgi:hypothetical protein